MANKVKDQEELIEEQEGQEQAMKMRQRGMDMASVQPSDDEYTITDLGNTRVIDGYNCREYLIEHEDGTTNTWMTTDLDIQLETLARAFASQSGSDQNQQMQQRFYDIDGFPIEATTVSKNGKETTYMRYSNILLGEHIDRSVFNTEGIEIMDLGF